MFDEYRCCAIKIKWIPSITAWNTNSSPYVPMFVFHDPNNVASPLATSSGGDECLQYESCKVFNCQRTWTYYRKLQRNIPNQSTWASQVNISSRGYIPTLYATGTQGIQMFLANEIQSTAYYVGNYVYNYIQLHIVYNCKYVNIYNIFIYLQLYTILYCI